MGLHRGNGLEVSETKNIRTLDILLTQSQSKWTTAYSEGLKRTELYF